VSSGMLIIKIKKSILFQLSPNMTCPSPVSFPSAVDFRLMESYLKVDLQGVSACVSLPSACWASSNRPWLQTLSRIKTYVYVTKLGRGGVMFFDAHSLYNSVLKKRSM